MGTAMAILAERAILYHSLEHSGRRIPRSRDDIRFNGGKTRREFERKKSGRHSGWAVWHSATKAGSMGLDGRRSSGRMDDKYPVRGATLCAPFGLPLPIVPPIVLAETCWRVARLGDPMA